MILIIDLCWEKDSLSKEEFVLPIANICKQPHSIKHMTELTKNDIEEADKIILCGTALKDNEFLKHTSDFFWIKEINKPLLGICAGMQIIAQVFDAPLQNKTEIGMKKITILENNLLFEDKDQFEAYSLHSNEIESNDNMDLLASSKECIHAIKIKGKNIYGIMFHPEVRNEWVIENFLEK